jgi:hypothetical protein
VTTTRTPMTPEERTTQLKAREKASEENYAKIRNDLKTLSAIDSAVVHAMGMFSAAAQVGIKYQCEHRESVPIFDKMYTAIGKLLTPSEPSGSPTSTFTKK